MKTTKTFRLLAVLLAMLLAFGAMPALAVEIDSGDYAVWTQNAVNDLYERLMAAENYSDYSIILNTLSEAARDSFFRALTEEQQAALEEHNAALLSEMELYKPVVRFTKVGPLLAAPVSGARMMRAAANGNDDSGIVLNKNVEKDGDNYKITLKAYATGTSTTVVTTDPVDIVLVLDVSGSMESCIVCGKENSRTHKAYTKDYTISNNEVYYIKTDSGYTEVKYCDGNHSVYKHDASWVPSSLHSSGSDHVNYITNNRKIVPKTATGDVAGEQFYSLVDENCTKRIDSLKSAVNSFIDNVATTSSDSQIAIVKFASDKRSYVGNETDRNGYNYSQIVKNLTKVDAGGQTTLKNSVNNLKAAGATSADYGMQHAQQIINSVKDDGRKKVVIMFTDGEPNHYSRFDTSVADEAISASKSIKDAGATVYTIGVFSGANGTPVNSLNGVSNTNKYMHLVSSNYKNATSMNSTGSATYPAGGKSYFLSASSHSDLMNIFESISQEVGGSTTELDSTSVIKDIVTPYFDLPENALEVKLYTAESNGSVNAWKEKKEFTEGTVTYGSTEEGSTRKDTVSVSGFSFKDNWCGDQTDKDGNKTFHNGKKLIIEFTVKPRDGFLGGNNVVTNGVDSGIYDKDGNNYGHFDVPVVDVTIKEPTITLPDANVYLGAYFNETVNAEDLKKGTTVKFGDNIELDLTKPKENWGLEAWQTDYVIIDVKVTDKDGKEVTDFKNLREDTDYTVSVSIKPKTEGTQKEYDTSPSGTIHVFTPELTFKDSNVDYMTRIVDYNYNTNNYASTRWIHKDEKTGDTKVAGTDGVTMLGSQTAPELTLDYTPTTGVTGDKVTATDCVPVKVTVEINNDDVTGYTTFVHQDCTLVDNCQWSSITPQGNGAPAFLLHVIKVYGDLTITKSGLNQHTYTGDGEDQESAIFKVESDNQTWYVAINANASGTGSVTLTGLKVGNYTVTELNSWTWRYANQTAQTATVVGGGTVTVEFKNEHTNQQWLGGDNYANNVFASTPGN